MIQELVDHFVVRASKALREAGREPERVEITFSKAALPGFPIFRHVRSSEGLPVEYPEKPFPRWKGWSPQIPAVCVAVWSGDIWRGYAVHAEAFWAVETGSTKENTTP